MLDARKNVLGNSGLLTESLFKRLVSACVRKVQVSRDLTDQDLGDMIACSAATVGHARNQEGKLQGHTLFNLIEVDPLAIEPLLHHFGRRSVPIAAKCDSDESDELVPTARAVASLAAVKSPQSPGGVRVTDAECISIEGDIDAAIEALSALKARCIDIRTSRAA